MSKFSIFLLGFFLCVGLAVAYWWYGKKQEQQHVAMPKVEEPLPSPVKKPSPPPSIDSPTLKTSSSYCTRESFEEKSYIVCRADPSHDDIRLFLNDEQGRPYKHFRSVNDMLSNQGEVLAFAMNAGMYHDDYSAVGLYIEKGKETNPISTRDGPGNFHLKPNGIFFIADGRAGVLETQSFLEKGIKAELATQSGPMLVSDNQLHPRFIVNSPFLHYRNGVGVTQTGEVMFVISQSRVNFDEMARFFRDQLHTPHALFLDGSISSLHAPEMHRFDWWHSLGPIIGVVVKK